MEKCKLCKKNDLENVGSHIFSEFIIRTAINQKGIVKRLDKEIIFEFSKEKFGLNYFGLGVQPDIIEEITGKEITDELIENNKNPFINRELVCRKCEEKFGPIESEFSKSVYSKIIKKSNDELKIDTCNYISFENKKWLALQFAIINVWRASASEYDNFKLNNHQEEYLRNFILKTADKKVEEILEKTIKYKKEIKDFYFALNYFIQKTENLTENGILVDNSKEPYFMLLNRFSILFDFKPLNENQIPKIISEVIEGNFNCIIANNQENDIRIGINSDEQRKNFFDKIAIRIAKQTLRSCNENFIEMHKRYFGFNPTLEIYNLYAIELNEYLKNKKGAINIADILKLMVDILINCGKNYY